MIFTQLPGEQEFLDEILTNPGDDAARLIYADWLDEQGDRRGAYLRVEALFWHADEGSSDREELREQLALLRGEINACWIAVISRPGIENCPLRPVRFEFQCPQNWERLTPTSKSHVRFCSACKRSVHYCSTIGEAQKLASSGRCIAIDIGVERREGDVVLPRRLLGRVRPIRRGE